MQNLPVQFIPSPVDKASHVQWYDPGELVQNARLLQLWLAWHSLISITGGENVYIPFIQKCSFPLRRTVNSTDAKSKLHSSWEQKDFQTKHLQLSCFTNLWIKTLECQRADWCVVLQKVHARQVNINIFLLSSLVVEETEVGDLLQGTKPVSSSAGREWLCFGHFVACFQHCRRAQQVPSFVVAT